MFSTDAGPTLVAAIELVSPSNKDRPQTRLAFAIKCASYLAQGIHLIVVDVVTNRTANLHNEIMALMEKAGFDLPPKAKLYAFYGRMPNYRFLLREIRFYFDLPPIELKTGVRLFAFK